MRITGKILYGINNIYTVESGNILYQCRIKGKIIKGEEKLYNPLTAGDMVEVQKDSHSITQGVIVSLNERRNVLTRWNRKRMALQLMASNFDILFCITSPDDPPFRPRFLDRMLLSGSGIYEKVILINKSDLGINKDIIERLGYYKKMGISVMECSAVRNEGMEEIKAAISNKCAVFAGQSGVGKSTIINAVTGEKLQKTGEISAKYSRGRHTTNYSVLIQAGNGSVIDTPGIRDIFIERVQPAVLSQMFEDFRHYAGKCGFSGCLHIAEPDCAVKKAVESGEIHPDRYTSYLRLYAEMTENAEEIYGQTYT